MESDRAIYLEMQRVKAQCPFIAQITRLSGSSDVVLMELDRRLTPYLPRSKWVLVVETAQFNIDRVRAYYQATIVEWLTEALETAHVLSAEPSTH